MKQFFLAAATFGLLIAGCFDGLAIAGDPCDGDELVFELDILPLLPEEVIGGSVVDAVVIAPDDIWAGGPMGLGGGESCTVTLHYDGVSWTYFPSPCPGAGGVQDVDIEAVDAVSSDEVYAVGMTAPGPIPSTFVIRWDGEAWEHLPAPGLSDPNDGVQGHFFTSVEAIGSDNIWFGGQTMFGGNNPPNAYMVHYDGSSFTEHILPKDPLAVNAAHRVRAISAIAPDDIWVAGSAGGDGVVDVTDLLTVIFNFG